MNSSTLQPATDAFSCNDGPYPELAEERDAYQQFCQCFIPPETWHTTAERVVSRLLLIVSILGNTLVIYILQRMKKNGEHSAMKLLIQSLSVADMLVCIMYNVNEVISVDSSLTTTAACKIFGGFLWTTMCSSSCLICCVSAERYLAVVKPLEFTIDTRRTALMIAFSWYYSILFTIPDFYFLQRHEYPFCGRGLVPLCNYDFLRGTDISVVFVVTISATFLVPLVFTVVTNVAVIRALMRTKGCKLFRKFRPTTDRGRRNVVFIVLLLTAIFVICSLPFATYQLLNAVNIQLPRNVIVVAYYLMLVNSTANAFVYSFFSADFRKSCKELFSTLSNRIMRS